MPGCHLISRTFFLLNPANQGRRMHMKLEASAACSDRRGRAADPAIDCMQQVLPQRQRLVPPTSSSSSPAAHTAPAGTSLLHMHLSSTTVAAARPAMCPRTVSHSAVALAPPLTLHPPPSVSSLLLCHTEQLVRARAGTKLDHGPHPHLPQRVGFEPRAIQVGAVPRAQVHH